MKWDNSLPTEILRFPAKDLRAKPIRKYVVDGNYPGVVTFTCGNAAISLRKELLPLGKCVVEVGERGVLQTSKWWTPAEIHNGFPHLFDATSGHLPLPLMYEIGQEFKAYLINFWDAFDELKQYVVPTGSGETIMCLRMAYPETRFMAAYNNSQPQTTRDVENVGLNAIVDALFPVQYWTGAL